MGPTEAVPSLQKTYTGTLEQAPGRSLLRPKRRGGFDGCAVATREGGKGGGKGKGMVFPHKSRRVLLPGLGVRRAVSSLSGHITMHMACVLTPSIVSGSYNLWLPPRMHR